ncbi:MAG TPA: FkbM family methyltransferase [Flavobacteriales bacterium]|nr:FkbM family methyltransferase [Flavobacteriales bacterium]
MNAKQLIRSTFERLTGLRVMRQPPFGTDRFADLRMVFPKQAFRTIMDVGANVGQSAVTFRKAWPLATVHCCEPVSSTFAKLRANVEGSMVICHQLAMGSKEEVRIIHLAADDRFSEINSLHEGHPFLADKELRKEEVRVTTLENFLRERSIRSVDYLKIDTEGHERSVLEGAQVPLRSEQVGIIDIEVGMNLDNKFHVPLMQVMDQLAASGYHLFGLYDQMHEWPTARPVLRSCNALFVPRRMAQPGSWSPFTVD